MGHTISVMVGKFAMSCKIIILILSLIITNKQLDGLNDEQLLQELFVGSISSEISIIDVDINEKMFLYGRNGSKILLIANVWKIFSYAQLFCIIKQQQIKKVHCWIVDKIIHSFYTRTVTDRLIN